MLKNYPQIELNVEGYPSSSFLRLVEAVKPTQCTLVPDAPEQLTSDHGWDLTQHSKTVSTVCIRLKDQGMRTAIFLDPDNQQLAIAATTGTDRIELYTEAYAAAYPTAQADKVLETYRCTALEAQKLGIGVNAGHDLNLQNLQRFLTIPQILEVSIGHALIVECIEAGMEAVTTRYLALCALSHSGI